MKHTIINLMTLLAFGMAFSQSRFDVASVAEFNSAHDAASAGDSIVWVSGTYSNAFMDITKNGLIVTAEESGSVIFNGASKVEIEGDNVTLSGVQFIGGNIGTSHVIRIWGSDVLITQINIQDYTSYKYLIVDEDSRRTTISYSNFENRLNLDDQNILSILVDDNEPGFHKIQYCSFKNFEGTGNDMGIEPIRIGVSSQGQFDSRTIVEYCYFSECDGDGEIISNKASQNVIRYNTFENNTNAELVLRHGNEAIVYGNFFLNNMGGVRVREGSGHFIYNNYFSSLDRRSIYLQNDPSDPLVDIQVYYNTIRNSAEMILGGDGSNPPTNVTIANNIFIDPTDQLFEDATGTENWLGNLSFGSLGITRPSGLDEMDPKLSENSEGFYQPDGDSPAIDASEDGFPSVPLFSGLEYDNEILLDLMKETRPGLTSEKDIGASEHSASVLVQPHATEENTGPFYLSAIDPDGFTIDLVVVGNGRIELNPVASSYVDGTSITATAVPDQGNELSLWTGDLSGNEIAQTFTISQNMEIGAIFSEAALSILPSEDVFIYSNPVDSFLKIEHALPNISHLAIEIIGLNGGTLLRKEISNPSNDTTAIKVDSLESGAYIVNVQLTLENRRSRSFISKFIKR